jgi:hypothetical protein
MLILFLAVKGHCLVSEHFLPKATVLQPKPSGFLFCIQPLSGHEEESTRTQCEEKGAFL